MVLAARKTDRKLVAAKNAGHKWKPDELAYLSRHYGLLPDEEIAAFLGRSRHALRIAAYRKLGGQKRKDNFYTSAEVARALGIRDSKSIIGWVRKGYLRGERGPMYVGLSQVWRFSEQAIIRCLHHRPYLVKPTQVRQHIFQRIVQDEWQRDPWYTPEQAAPFLGVKTPDAIHKYIHQGLLRAQKKPGGPWQGIWIIRKSDIDGFLANDPRPEHKTAALRQSRQRLMIALGRPVRLETIWLIICPECKSEVRVAAPAKMWSPRLLSIFKAKYVNNGCHHGSQCSLNGSRPNPMLTLRKCPKCGGRLQPGEDGMECFICGKVIYY